MDPISAIFVMTVLTGLFVKGVDVATDGLLSAEIGAGIRGAGSYTARDVRDRWRRASAKAREVRMQTRQGRAVQEILDDAAAVGRTGWTIGRLLFGEARQFGSGIRSEWQTARDQARSVRTERRGDAPWPVTQWLRDGLVRLRETRTKTPNEETEQPNETPNGDPEPSPFAAAEDSERESDDLGPLSPTCPDCGMPLVISSLSDHRMGRDRCHYADMDDAPNEIPKKRPQPPPGFRYVPSRTGDVHGHFTWDLPWPDDDLYADMDDDPDDPNGDPNVPLESTVPDENGDVRCGCCAQLHKPLAPGEHCPDCHIHDHPNGTTPNAPTTKGPGMTDINNAPAAIAAWEAFTPIWESLQSRADALQGEIDTLTNDAAALHGEVATLADGMGDFAVGGEADTAAAVGELSDAATSAKERADVLADSIGTAKQAVDSYRAQLEDDLRPGIEAAAGKVADVHSVMQEA